MPIRTFSGLAASAQPLWRAMPEPPLQAKPPLRGHLWSRSNDVAPDGLARGPAATHLTATAEVAAAAGVSAEASLSATASASGLRVRVLSSLEVAMFSSSIDLGQVRSGQGFEVRDDEISRRALKRRLGQAVKRALGPDYSLRYKPRADGEISVTFMVESTSG